MAATSIEDLRPAKAAFDPTFWGDAFSSFSLDDKVQESYAEGIEELKKKAREKLMAPTNSGKQIIILVDTIERLGLAYHFEKEIEEKIQQIYDQFYAENEEDMFTIALGFRLLRQHRYLVSSGVFDKFTNKDKKFEETLIDNVEGLLNLYEAAHIRIHGEDILEEAVAFTTHHLTRVLPQLESPIKDKVKRALEHPIHKAVPIIEARLYISIYEKDESGDEGLLKMAKLNFNYMQNLYKDELSQLSRWWNKFDLTSKLPYARNRLIECFLWGVSFHFEPQYSQVRVAVAKSLKLATIIDDTYDNYATLEEAQLFSEILERWINTEQTERVPNWMKIACQFVMSICEDYERDATKQEKPFASSYFKEALRPNCISFSIPLHERI